MPVLRLTDRTIAALKPTPGKQIDYMDHAFPDFGVRVSPQGTKSFFLRYRTPDGHKRRHTLGVYPLMRLGAAHTAAHHSQRRLTVGRDPAAEERQWDAQTFGALAALYMTKHAIGPDPAQPRKRSWRADARVIRRELNPAWEHRPVRTIRRQEVRELLERIVARGAPTLAIRVFALIRKMFNFGLKLDEGWLDANVAAGLDKPAAERSRSRVLTTAEVQAFWKWAEQPPPDALPAVDQRRWRLNHYALQLRLVTAQRGQEVFRMRRSDVDGAWWTIPAQWSKNGLAHRVYLSKRALAIIGKLEEETSAETDDLFVGVRGKSRRRGALAGLGVSDIRPHDLRRTAATVMASGGVPRLTIAKVLNHVDNTVTAIYDRASYDADKQAALTWWSAKLDAILAGRTSKVIPFLVSRPA